MTLHLYISYSSNLTEEEQLDIDRSVLENRRAVIKFAKKVYVNGKTIVISTAFGICVLISTPKKAYGIGCH